MAALIHVENIEDISHHDLKVVSATFGPIKMFKKQSL